jgi:hypothetical protein
MRARLCATRAPLAARLVQVAARPRRADVDRAMAGFSQSGAPMERSVSLSQDLPPRTRFRAAVRLVALAAMVVGATLAFVLQVLPLRVATRATYCTVCALHRETTEQRSPLHFRGMPFESWFSRTTTVDRGGVLHKLLAPAVGDHPHAFVEPAAWVPPTNVTPNVAAEGALAQVLAEDEVHDLAALEESPHLLALLDTAMHEDRERAVRLAHRVLDPKLHLPSAAIALLDRGGAWDARFRVVDAFLARWQCTSDDSAATCTMPAGAAELIVLARTPTSTHAGTIDWPRWSPPSATTIATANP